MTTAKLPRPPACTGCDLNHAAFGYAPYDGPDHPRLCFLGEALGSDEAFMGKPFVGAAGGVLSRVLHRAGILRENVGIENTIRCQPPNNWFDDRAPYYYQALGSCAQYRNQTFDRLPKEAVIVPLGATAIKTMLNLHGAEGIAVKDFHGTVTRSPDDRFWVVPTFHPSHLQRGAMNLLEVVTSDLRLADTISAKGFQRSRAELVVDPHPDWFANWVDRHLVQVRMDADGTWLALDTEFPESIKGQDESEFQIGAASDLLRVNVSNGGDHGITVPYTSAYIPIIETLLKGLSELRGICYAWNKYADWDHLQQAGHTVSGIECYDLMWGWHYLQSDLPRGLGFVAPMASDFGAWKHWAKQTDLQGKYAAADALQTFRCAVWIVKALIAGHQWDLFVNDWHERDSYVLRPAHLQGVPADRAALEAFHADLQQKQSRLLERFKTTAAQGVLKPKLGYAKKPKSDVPPKSIFGKEVTGAEAKATYLKAAVTLVERSVTIDCRCCLGCGAEDVGAAHRCRAGSADPAGPRQLVIAPRVRVRWFWQLPFNPDAPAQILAYLQSRGEAAPLHKKTRKPTTEAKALKALSKKTDDPFYQLQLDWKAVQKVDSTYALGALKRLDTQDRLHPEITCKPSTLRDSCVDPNLQNVVADRSGPAGLASGFRKCIVAVDGVPTDRSADELAAWEASWSR